MPRRIILDCDTGTDDAVAIMLAALHPDLDLLAVTTVWGNADVEITTDNTLRVLDLVGRGDVPVYAGRGNPLSPPPLVPDEDDDGRTPQLPIPEPVSAARPAPAVEWLVETLRASTEPVTLVPTGPLTNIAAALALDPELSDAVDEVVVMGGGHARGNVTPSADRNFWNDAAAAQIVLDAGFERLVLVTLDATFDAALDSEDSAAFEQLGTSAGLATARFLDERIRDYAALPSMAALDAAPVHDALAVAAVIDPGVVRLRRVHVAVELRGELTYGRSVIDLEGIGGRPPNAHVALEADAASYAELLRATFARG